MNMILQLSTPYTDPLYPLEWHISYTKKMLVPFGE